MVLENSRRVEVETENLEKASRLLFIYLFIFAKNVYKKIERKKLKVMGTEKWSHVGNFITKICVM